MERREGQIIKLNPSLLSAFGGEKSLAKSLWGFLLEDSFEMTKQ